MSHNISFEIAYCNIDDNEDLSKLAIQLKEAKLTEEQIIDDSQIKKLLLLKNKTTLIVVTKFGYLYKFSFSLEGVSCEGSLRPKNPEFENQMVEIQHIMELSNGFLSVCSQCNDIFICNVSVSPFQIESILSGHQDTVYSLCELNNAQYLVSGSQDSYLFIWNGCNVIKKIGGKNNKTLIPSPILYFDSTKNFVVNWKSTTNSLENSCLEFYDYTGQSIKCIKNIFTGNEGKMFEIKEKDHLVVAFDNELDAEKNEKCLIIVDYIHFKVVTRIPVYLDGDDYCFDLYLDSLLFWSGKGQLYQINMYKNYEIQTKITFGCSDHCSNRIGYEWCADHEDPECALRNTGSVSVGKFLYAIEDQQIIVVDNEKLIEEKCGEKTTYKKKGGLTYFTFKNTLPPEEGKSSISRRIFEHKEEEKINTLNKGEIILPIVQSMLHRNQIEQKKNERPLEKIETPPKLRRIINKITQLHITEKHCNMKTPIVLLSNKTIVIGTKDATLEFYIIKDLTGHPSFQRENYRQLCSSYERNSAHLRKAIISITEISNHRIVVATEFTDKLFIIDYINKNFFTEVHTKHNDVLLTVISLPNDYFLTTSFDGTVIISNLMERETFKRRVIRYKDTTIPYATTAIEDGFLVCWKSNTEHTLTRYDFKGVIKGEIKGQFTNEQGGLFYVKKFNHIVVVYQDESEKENKDHHISILDLSDSNLRELHRIKDKLLTNYPPYSFNFFNDSLFYANNSCLFEMSCLNKYEITKIIIMDNQFDGDLLEFITYETMDVTQLYILCDTIIRREKQSMNYREKTIYYKGLSLFRAFIN